jgi:hypothetical protein
VAGDEMQEFTVEAEHIRKQTTAERDRVSHDRLEYRPQVGRRSADYAKNFRGCRLLFECLGEFLFQIGAGLADAPNARSRLRSRRTKTASVRSAFLAFARRGHLNRPHAEDQAFRVKKIARKPKRV